MFVLENSNESCKEKAADEAAIQIRKFYPIYGDSNDTTHTTGDDRPLPYELKDRIDVYIEKRVKENSEKYKSEVQQSSTFNALIRKEIKAGNLLVRKLGSQMTSLKTSSGRPFLSYSETFDENKTAEFVRWFIKNEPFANVISNRSSNIIFEAGNIPSVPFGYNPSKNKKFDNLSDWFISKLTQDIKKLKMVSQSEFKNFLDKLGEAGDETLIASGKIGVKYNLNFDKFIYENEVQKIPEGEERDIFKKNFLDDNVISAEQRILAWLYNEWFEEAYKIPEK